MIGEGYGYMEDIAATMREAQLAIMTARMAGETQRGSMDGREDSLTIAFK